MTERATPRAPRRRHRIGWVLPLVAALVVPFVGLLAGGILETAGAPEALWRAAPVVGTVGAIIAVVVFLVEVVRVLSPGGTYLSPEDRAAYDEYVRVYGPQPRRFPVAILAASILLSILTIGAAVVVVLHIAYAVGLTAEPPTAFTPTGSGFIYILLAVLSTPVLWAKFVIELRASRSPARPVREAAGGRRHRLWVLPLLSIPAIIACAVLIIVALRSGGAPLTAIRTTSALMFVGIAIALVLVVIGTVRVLRTPPAPRRPRGPGYFERAADADAERRGLSRDEYGVFKGNGFSVVRPVTSAGGLLFLAILITAFGIVVATAGGIIIAQGLGVIPDNPNDRELSPVEWAVAVFSLAFIPISWRYYIVERRAQNLRVERDLPTTLQ